MARRAQFARLILLTTLVGLAFAGLCYRLVDLQVLRHVKLAEEARTFTHLESRLEPRRGDILDCRGDRLATTEINKEVHADPSLLGQHYADVARVVAPLLQLSERDLAQKLVPRFTVRADGTTNAVLDVTLKKEVPSETWDKLRETMAALHFGLDDAQEKKLKPSEKAALNNLRKRGLFARDEPKRIFPNGPLAAHVIGYATTEPQTADEFAFNQIIGHAGIEQQFNMDLSGLPGWRLSEKNAHRTEMVSMRDQDVAARDGMNVVLTLDSALQNRVETALAEAWAKHSPQSISCIVVRPRTGEILALANLPTYNPNDLKNVNIDSMRNRAIADGWDPGSTFKIVVVSGAYNDHTVVPTDTFDCELGQFKYAGRTLHDHDRQGVLTVEQIITHSSNIGAAKVGIRMGENRLYDYILGFGFGQRSLITLPGEAKGIVNKLKDWSKVSIAQIPMGQGITVTPLQMVMAMCTIANDGVLMRPMIVSRFEDHDGKVVATISPTQIRRVISSETAKLMVTALKTVVSSNGTAANAALEHYVVAGKTGTAQKVEDNHQYSTTRFLSSFIGFFPADNPEICISVVLNEPKGGHYGGKIAAPVFKQIAEYAANRLNIRPDDADNLTAAVGTGGATNDNRLARTSLAHSQQ
jgi:cell division protein FtsI/penicillin-binding protein 2